MLWYRPVSSCSAEARFALYSLYSGRCRPACRNSQTGTSLSHKMWGFHRQLGFVFDPMICSFNICNYVIINNYTHWHLVLFLCVNCSWGCLSCVIYPWKIPSLGLSDWIQPLRHLALQQIFSIVRQFSGMLANGKCLKAVRRHAVCSRSLLVQTIPVGYQQSLPSQNLAKRGGAGIGS